MKIRAVAQVGEDVRLVGERRLADPGHALAAHLGEGRGVAVHPGHHVMAADARPPRASLRAPASRYCAGSPSRRTACAGCSILAAPAVRRLRAAPAARRMVMYREPSQARDDDAPPWWASARRCLAGAPRPPRRSCRRCSAGATPRHYKETSISWFSTKPRFSSTTRMSLTPCAKASAPCGSSGQASATL